jgi:hypothetical protein
LQAVHAGELLRCAARDLLDGAGPEYFSAGQVDVVDELAGVLGGDAVAFVAVGQARLGCGDAPAGALRISEQNVEKDRPAGQGSEFES